MLFRPVPTADHAAPLHIATRFAVTLPIAVNEPTAYKVVLSYCAMAFTLPFNIPVPRPFQVAPSHLATRFEVTPPAVVKAPPAIRGQAGVWQALPVKRSGQLHWNVPTPITFVHGPPPFWQGADAQLSITVPQLVPVYPASHVWQVVPDE